MELIRQLDRQHRGASAAANQTVPERFAGPNEDPVPRFLQVDFGLMRTPDGAHRATSWSSCRPSRRSTACSAPGRGLSRGVRAAARRSTCYLGGLDATSYEAMVGSAILGGHDPDEVVLMEIEPRRQKTWPDFAITEYRSGACAPWTRRRSGARAGSSSTTATGDAGADPPDLQSGDSRGARSQGHRAAVRLSRRSRRRMGRPSGVVLPASASSRFRGCGTPACRAPGSCRS